MTPELELERTDYHLRLMIERMQRDGRSEAAIEKAVLSAAGSKPRCQDCCSTRQPSRRSAFHGNGSATISDPAPT